MLFIKNDVGETDTYTELRNIILFINDFTAKLGIARVEIADWKIQSIINGMHFDFPHVDGEDAASVFKKIANFVCYFVGDPPVIGQVPLEYSPDLNAIKNGLNAVIAFEIARKAFEGAKIVWSHDKSEHILVNRIEVSRHSYVDIVDALSSVMPNSHFKMVSVLFEQLAYRANPDCEYPRNL